MVVAVGTALVAWSVGTAIETSGSENELRGKGLEEKKKIGSGVLRK
jgi:hypothetical protein